MYFNIIMNKQKLQFFVFLVLLILILSNFVYQWSFFPNYVRIVKRHHLRSIGHEFIPFLPYLKGVESIGYLTCLKSSSPSTDPAVTEPYIQAKFVLSPAILDNHFPLDNRYIILQCPDDLRAGQIRRQLSARLIIKTRDGISLLYRKNNIK